jgi:hypothetical protein
MGIEKLRVNSGQLEKGKRRGQCFSVTSVLFSLWSLC